LELEKQEAEGSLQYRRWMSVAKFNYNVAMPWTSKGLRKRLEGDKGLKVLFSQREYTRRGEENSLRE
jgi:hypothetical protein